MLGAQEEKEWKREAIILPIRKCFLLLFHTSEAHLQTIWNLEICCETWGEHQGPAVPCRAGGPLPCTLSPMCQGLVSFTAFFITLLPARLLPGLQHLCCITGQNTIPTPRQANCISCVSLAQLHKHQWN